MLWLHESRAYLYLNSPDHAMVLCVDKNRRLEHSTGSNRTCLWIPTTLRPKRTTSSATAIRRCLRRWTSPPGTTKVKAPLRYVEFLDYQRLIDKEVTAVLDVRLVLDSYHSHRTPTYSSWLEHVERWFGLLSEKVLNGSGNCSVHDLVDPIQAFTEGHNAVAKPCVWAATDQAIFKKAEGSSKRMPDTRH